MTVKEGVGRTYAGVDGFCPLAAYLGRYGYCLELALRPSVQHSARETGLNIERVIPMAQRLSAAGPKAPLLARFDSGFDSVAIMAGIEACNDGRATGLPQVDWLIKWNPRTTNVATLAETKTGDSVGRGGSGLVFPLPTQYRDDMWPQGEQVSRQFARAEVDANAEQGKWET